MAAVKINNLETTCIHIDIVCDARDEVGACQSGTDVARILRQLADKFDAGKNPMTWSEDSVPGANVDYL